MKISMAGEGAELRQALSPTVPKESKCALPRLIMGQIQKTSGILGRIPYAIPKVEKSLEKFFFFVNSVSVR